MLAQAGGQSPPPSSPGQGDGPPAFLQLVPIILIFVVFYLFLIRPQSQQRKQHQQMLANVKSGDVIVTSGGIHGTIANIKEKTLVVRIADGVKIELDKASVARVTKKASGDEATEKK
jgi:preprotein translocase subunit YajC